MKGETIILPDGYQVRAGSGDLHELIDAACSAPISRHRVFLLLRTAQIALNQAATRAISVPDDLIHFLPSLDSIDIALGCLWSATAWATDENPSEKKSLKYRRWAAKHLVIAAAEIWGAERYQPNELKSLAHQFREEWSND